MKRLRLKTGYALALLCFALHATGLFAQGLQPFLGDLTPCPGSTVTYGITGSSLYCSEMEYEITVTPVDENGNELTLDFTIGVPQLTARVTQGGLTGGLENWPVVGYEFKVTWGNPPSRQFRWARICFRARCYRETGHQTVVGPEWYTRCVTVELQVVDPVTITGPQQVECCALEPLTYCATPGNLSSYQWTVPSGWTIQGPSDKACITVIPNGTGGTVTAKPYNSECNSWGPSTSHSVQSTVCTRATIDVLQPVPCNGSAAGSIRLNPPPGFTITSITWRDQNGAIINQGQTTLTGLAPGTYTAEMVLSNGCTALESIHLTGPQDDSPLDISFALSRYDAGSWSGGPDCVYHIEASPSGGLAPYSFEWSGYPSNDDLFYLNAEGPGNVTLTITDARGCTYTETVAVPSCPGINVGDISDLTINSNPNSGLFTAAVQTTSNGAIDFKIVSAMNNVVYTYSAGQTTAGNHQYQVDITNKPNGIYFLTVTLNGTNPVTAQVIKQ